MPAGPSGTGPPVVLAGVAPENAGIAIVVHGAATAAVVMEEMASHGHFRLILDRPDRPITGHLELIDHAGDSGDPLGPG